MQVFRIAREQYAHTLSGRGAALKGARWNSPGTEMIYTAGNRSLAMAEVAVHLTFATLPDDFRMICIEIPDDIKITEIRAADLPENWDIFPHPGATQKLGDKFIFGGEFCVLKVPSVITEGDYNFLINPLHPDFEKIKITSIKVFRFDGRIIKA